jgi:glutamate-1-semialdehyde 2,1-aminomutase
LSSKKGEGSYIWDMDDYRYIDYCLAFGSIILGHAHLVVNQHVKEAIGQSTLFAWTPFTGVAKVQLTNTDTEAI